MQIIEIRYPWSSFNNFAIKNFTSFITMTLIIARKAITAVLAQWLCNLLKYFNAV